MIPTSEQRSECGVLECEGPRMTAATKKQTAVDDVSVSGVSDSWNVCVTQLMDVIWRWII